MAKTPHGAAPGPKGWLRFLIAVLFCLPVLSGLALYGQLHQGQDSIPAGWLAEWEALKDHAWFVWATGAAAMWGAGWLLSNRFLKSTRWLAAVLIWSGAILAPTVGVVALPPTMPVEMVESASWGYVLMGIRGGLFAVVCSLYLAFSKQVKAIYVLAAPVFNADRAQKNALYSVLGLLVVFLPLAVIAGGVAMLNYSLWGLVLMVIGGAGFVWLLVRPER